MSLPLLFVLAQVATPHAVAARASSAPVIDGSLADTVWSEATIQDGFRQKFPNEGAPPAERTSFRVLFDETSVYIGIDCVQEMDPIVARLTRRDRPTEADKVTVIFDSRGDGRGAYEFAINAAGVQFDAIRFNDTDLDPDWDESWESSVATTTRGWSAELRIPLRTLRFDGSRGRSWGIQVRRYVSLRQETDEWSFVTAARGGVMAGERLGGQTAEDDEGNTR